LVCAAEFDGNGRTHLFLTAWPNSVIQFIRLEFVEFAQGAEASFEWLSSHCTTTPFIVDEGSVRILIQ
jgi:hypothetical protein